MKIKYDKKSQKILLIASVISVVMAVVGIVLMFLEIYGTEVLALFSLEVGAVLSVVCIVRYICSILYLRRLKAYGYEVPEDRRDYEILQNVPRGDGEAGKSIFSAHSHFGMIACNILFVIFLLLDFMYFMNWSFMEDNSIVLSIMMAIFYLSWMFMSLVLNKQSDKDKYRDDVEIDSTRKERWSTERIVCSILLLFAISLFANSTANSMTKYIFRARIQADKDHLQEIVYAVTNSMKDNEDFNNPSFREISEGVEIISWGIPSDTFQEKVAENLGITDYYELQTKIKCSDGPAKIHVEIKDELIEVKLLNPVKAVEKYGHTIIEARSYDGK